MDDHTVVTHPLTVDRGDGERVRAHVMVTSNDTAALVYGDHEHDELTLQIQARCPANLDVLDVVNCDCAERYQRGLTRVAAAPLGMFIYVNTSSDVDETYFDVGKLLGQLSTVRRVRLLNYTVAEAQVLRDAGYEVTHLDLRDVADPGRDADRPRRGVVRDLRAGLTVVRDALRGYR